MAKRKAAPKPITRDDVEARDVYLVTTRRDGSKSYTQHRVWNTMRFLISKEIESKMDDSKLMVITKQQFDEARKSS